MERKHAILTASGASRWLACTPSARLEEQFPDKEGVAAKEGTLAHSLGELMISHKLKTVSKERYKWGIKVITEDPLYDNAMQEHCENYAAFVLERFSEAQSHTSDAKIFLETKLDLTDYIPEGFGTADVTIIADGVLDIIDLKYGKGVPVSAEQNKQMMLYSLGALSAYDFLYDINTVRVTIYQPRLDSISTWEIPVQELHNWAETELKAKAKEAFEGNGEYRPGEHCRFCKAKAVCRANAEMNLEVAQYDFAVPAILNDQEISDILDRAELFVNWITSVKDHALDQAVNHGKKWPNYKLVEGKSNRKYSDEEKVADTLLKAGFAEEIIYTKSVNGITAMEKAIGKAAFAEHLNPLVIKPQGKPTLVHQSDKRPEMNALESAQADFAEQLQD